MTKGIFKSVINKIRMPFNPKILKHSENIPKNKAKGSTVIKIILIATFFVIVLISAFLIRLNKTPDTEISDIEIGEEITVGAGVYEKETTGHKVGVKCLSFYQEKTITLDVFMSQERLIPDDKLDGYPVLEVFADTDDAATSTAKGKLIINGKKQSYKKEFTRDDLSYLFADDYDQSVFAGHSEEIMLKFKNFKPGDTIAVRFSYGFFYYKDNPYDDEYPDNSWCGQCRDLFFYIGENGISVSSNGIDSAIANYEECNKKLIEMGKEPGKGALCSAKDLYLKPLSDNLCKTQHGNCLVNLFSIVSSEECEQYLIRITGSNGINIVGDTEYITSDDILKIQYYLTDCNPYGTINVEVCETDTSEKTLFQKQFTV